MKKAKIHRTPTKNKSRIHQQHKTEKDRQEDKTELEIQNESEQDNNNSSDTKISRQLTKYRKKKAAEARINKKERKQEHDEVITRQNKDNRRIQDSETMETDSDTAETKRRYEEYRTREVAKRREQVKRTRTNNQEKIRITIQADTGNKKQKSPKHQNKIQVKQPFTLREEDNDSPEDDDETDCQYQQGKDVNIMQYIINEPSDSDASEPSQTSRRVRQRTSAEQNRRRKMKAIKKNNTSSDATEREQESNTSSTTQKNKL